MSALYPFFRLAARPSVVLGWVWAAWLFSGIPVLTLLHGPVSILDITSASQLSPERWRALWQTAMLFPASAAAVSAFVTLEALHASWSWSIPSLRSALVKGLAVIAAVSSLPVPLLLARMDAGPAALAAFGVGVFSFGAVAIFFGRMILRPESWFALGIMAPAIWKAEYVAAWATAHPWLVTILALDGAALWLYLGYSAGGVRELAALSAPTRWWSRKGAGKADQARLWNRELARGRIADWILACEYEAWGCRTRFGWPGMVAGTFMLMGAIASFFAFGDVPASSFAVDFIGIQAVLIAPMTLWAYPPLLRTGRLYPMTRRQRAVVFWWGSLATTVVLGTIALVCLSLLAIGLPLLPWWKSDPPALADVLKELPFALVWLPIVTWVHTRYVKVDHLLVARGGGAGGMRYFLQLMTALLLFATASFGMAVFVGDGTVLGTGLLRIIAIVVTAALVQLTYWLLLRRHFAKGDLV